MGYDVHITRAENWFDSGDHPISLDEWTSYVASDPEMTMPADNLAQWRDCPFLYEDGAITVKYPEVEVRIKMAVIAKALSAKVQGDDGEVYDECGNAVPDPYPPVEPPRPWWKRLFQRNR